MPSVLELVAELPDLRAQAQGAPLAARTKEGTPLMGHFEHLEKSGTSLHISSARSWANRPRARLQECCLEGCRHPLAPCLRGEGVLYPLLHTHTVARFI